MSGITLRVRSLLRVRDGEPSTSAAVVDRIDPGAIVTAVGEVQGDTVSGNAAWYQLDGNRFIWSGGVERAAGVTPPNVTALPVATYPNGRIKVLDDAGIQTVFGTFGYSEISPRGAIKIAKAWSAQNITGITVPLLTRLGHGKLWVNVHAADAFQRVFAAIDAAGLGDRILTCDGTWVPRHKTWNPARGLSSHSWGIAIDLNARWNGYNVAPPAVGKIGSVRELIPFFAAEGFGWGGDFSEPDGMHFELALEKL